MRASQRAQARLSNAHKVRSAHTPEGHLSLRAQANFDRLSNNIVGKVDDMGARLDELEKTAGELEEAMCEPAAGEEKK